ncbi:hypothetical protein A2686_03080 [Candidatus Woesebacteria bacterium RIFCSPHIGHO2_01_FULL_38_10]|nr:MAG: hypothetical protein A2686_03080 [Candidatus Woesebacteria bacterium RIFCSPHIGHO2_01_FULL_38_10]
MNIRVKGKQKLSGEVYPSGSKNSIVFLLPASLMFNQEVILRNVPEVSDVERLLTIMKKLGSKIEWNRKEKEMKIDNSELSFNNISKDDLGNMRGTSLLWGPMLARFRKVNFDELPGGCTLGFRTLFPHYDAFRHLGVKIQETSHGVKMDATKANGSEFWLSEMSPTATGNALMLASNLKGKTRIVGAASEPQVQDLCNFLSSAGVKIQGIGSNVLEIEGVGEFSGVDHSLFSDHYEIATFLAMAAVTGGRIKVHHALPFLFHQINEIFSKFNINIYYKGETAILEANQKIQIKSEEEGRRILTIKAQPWPALPVDLLPIFIPIALSAKKGQALFHNWMYEAGLFWTSELNKLGANIVMCDPHRIIVIAGQKLTSATLEAPYIIRAVVAMVMAVMIAEGESLILNADALYRGHPHFSENLKMLGAEIEEVE